MPVVTFWAFLPGTRSSPSRTSTGQRPSVGVERCVMTTLDQGDLPKDSGILRTAAQHNQVNVGVYASVLRGGEIHRGDAVSVR